ncbi:MAG: hypothetical protein ACJA2M_001340 [Polaribacter sp.]|jgi:hypothetical protein
MEKNKEIHDKAWNLLGKKGLKLGEKMMVRSAFVTWSGYKDEHPFISTYRDEDGQDLYQSTHEMINNFVFQKREEVVLANAIYLNMNEIHSERDLIEFFKYTCKIIGISNAWT